MCDQAENLAKPAADPVQENSEEMTEVIQRLEAKAGEEQERLKELCHFWDQQILQLEKTTKAVVQDKMQEVSEKLKKRKRVF
jgi:hypothetical protein